MRPFIIIFTVLMLFMVAGFCYAFPQDSCGPEECQECHWLTKDEASEMLGDLVSDVVEVNYSDVKGLWEAVVIKSGKKIPVYIDFSRKYLISGTIVKLENMENLTSERILSLNKIDVSQIPLDDAVTIGDPSASFKIIVFDDPECPYCKKLHPEMKAVVQKDPGVAFFIKMLPLDIHPEAFEKAKAIICSKSSKMLEDSLNGKPIPSPDCETDQVEKNKALATKLGIRSVPTLIYPDGMVVPGASTSEKIGQLIDLSKTALGGNPGD